MSDYSGLMEQATKDLIYARTQLENAQRWSESAKATISDMASSLGGGKNKEQAQILLQVVASLDELKAGLEQTIAACYATITPVTNWADENDLF